MLPRVAARFCQGYLTGCLPDRADGVVARHSRDSPRDGSRMCSAVTRNDARSAHFRRLRQSRPCTSVTREKPEASAMRVRHKQSSTASAFIRFGQLPASEGHSCGPVTCVCGYVVRSKRVSQPEYVTAVYSRCTYVMWISPSPWRT
eukprot:s1605_g9.t1